MTVEVCYHGGSRLFFCRGKVDWEEFNQALLEQWPTDIVLREDMVQHGFWYLDEANLEEVTFVSGDIVGLGPSQCPFCTMPLSFVERNSGLTYVDERWRCPQCGASLYTIATKTEGRSV